MSIKDLYYKWKARQHEKTKKRIERLKLEKNSFILHKAPAYKVTMIEKEIKRLEKRLWKGR